MRGGLERPALSSQQPVPSDMQRSILHSTLAVRDRCIELSRPERAGFAIAASPLYRRSLKIPCSHRQTRQNECRQLTAGGQARRRGPQTGAEGTKPSSDQRPATSNQRRGSYILILIASAHVFAGQRHQKPRGSGRAPRATVRELRCARPGSPMPLKSPANRDEGP